MLYCDFEIHLFQPNFIYIDGNTSKPHISIFDQNEILWKYVFDTNLFKVSVACTKIQMQSI